jgi:hypothetical protein
MAPCTVGAAPVATLQPDEIYTRSAGGVTLVKAYDEEGKLMSIGSAVLIAPENLLTNCHVLAKAKRIEIKQEQSVFEAKLVYVDIERDLCQIAAQNFHATPVEIGDSDALQGESARPGTYSYGRHCVRPSQGFERNASIHSNVDTDFSRFVGRWFVRLRRKADWHHCHVPAGQPKSQLRNTDQFSSRSTRPERYCLREGYRISTEN